MICVTINAPGAAQCAPHCYAIAGQHLLVPHKVDALQAFFDRETTRLAAESSQSNADHAGVTQALSSANAQRRFDDLTPLASKLERLTYWRAGRYAQIDIDGKPACHIDFEKKHLHLLSAGDLNRQLNLEIILGPALIVLLAEDSLYCLHASAIDSKAGVIGFIAESGVGKSTLAAPQGEAWQRISDDVLPMRAKPGLKEVTLFADFPQLKLSPTTSRAQLDSVWRLSHLIRLDSTPAEPMRFTRLAPKDALLQIVRHTVAAKLFDPGRMREHLRFAQTLSMSVPMSVLSYPRDRQRLPVLRRSIVEYCVGHNLSH